MSKDTVSGLRSTGSVMTPLIPFNMIVDTDVGVLTLIFSQYRDRDVFNIDYATHCKRRKLIQDLYNRKEENPLTLIIRDEYKDQADDFYEQFIDQRYRDILRYSELTDIYTLTGLYRNDMDIHPTIICENSLEREELLMHEYTKNCNIILSSDINPAKIKGYNQFFFKSIPDATPYASHMMSKTVYFSGEGYNLTEENKFVDHPVIDLLQIHNRLAVIDLYSRDKLKSVEDNENE